LAYEGWLPDAAPTIREADRPITAHLAVLQASLQAHADVFFGGGAHAARRQMQLRDAGDSHRGSLSRFVGNRVKAA